MIPLRDKNPTRTRPWVTYGLLATCLIAYGHQISLGGWAGKLFVLEYGVVPLRLMTMASLYDALPLVTHMFLHSPVLYENSISLGALMHLVGNMWFLFVFADNVEDNFGKLRFLAFYLVCGLAAAFAQIAIDPTSRLPMIGASGAIAGVLGAYAVLYPRARIVTIVPIFIFIQFVELPALLFIVLWFGFQLLMGLTSLGQVASGGVAFFAHIGGFLAGLVLVRFFRRVPHSTHGFRSRTRR